MGGAYFYTDTVDYENYFQEYNTRNFNNKPEFSPLPTLPICVYVNCKR